MYNVLLDYSKITPDFLVSLKEHHCKKVKELNDNICLINNENLSWDNLFGETVKYSNENVNLAYFAMRDFCKDEKIRELCNSLNCEMSTFGIEESMRIDVYNKFIYWYHNIFPNEKESLDQEKCSYIENLFVGYKMLGLNLPQEKYERVKEIQKELTTNCSTYSLNLSNESNKYCFRGEDLIGLPDDYLLSRKLDDKLYQVTLKYPDFLPIMDYCQNRNTREYMAKEYKSRCILENSEIAEKVFNLRKELAQIFGFNNYSDYKLQNKMASNTNTVNKFLDELRVKMKPILADDKRKLLEIATNDNITNLESYDIAYYSRIYQDLQSKIPKEELKTITQQINGK
jgi:Zn-dependent oligopeptidase